MRGLLIAAVVAAPSFAFADGPNGTWKTQTSDTGAYLHVRIGPCSYDTAKTCGVIAESFGSTRTDLVGKPIIRDMTPNGDSKWNKGQIWAPDDDKTYRSKMTLRGDVLKVEGCVAVFCRGQNWTRVN